MRVTLTRGWIYQPCDVAIMYGLANPQRQSLQGQLRNSIHREHKGPIVVIESSLLGRGFKPAAPRWVSALRRRPLRPRQVHPYFRVAVGGALGDDADFCAANSPPDRWEAQAREVGIKLAPYRSEGRHVLILGQVGRDASLRGLDIVTWLGETARAVRERTSRPIVVRLHPSMRWRDRERALAAFDGVPGLTVAPIGTSFAADIAGAWTCVTYSSGGAVDALLAGVPPICLSPASLAYRLCSRSLDEIEAPLEPDREQFLRDLAYSQWTREEMADGSAWRHVWPSVRRKLEQTTAARAAQHSAGDSLPAARRRALLRRLNALTWLCQAFPKSAGALQGRAETLLKLGHVVEAKSTFEALLLKRPNRASAHRGLAQAAERLGLWDEALTSWRVVSELRPDKAGALSGVGRAAMRLARLDEAEAAFRKLAELAPDRPEGLRGLERVATEHGQWTEALELQQRSWGKFRDPEVAHRHALLLVRLDRLDDLQRFADGLSEDREPVAYLFALTQLQSATHDWERSVDLLDRHRALTTGNWQLLGMHVVALRRVGRIDEALRLLEHSSAGSATQRASRTIECLIEARRYEQADRLLQAAWESGALEKIGGGMLAAMVTAAQEIGGVALARSVLDGLTPSAGRSGHALRLNRIFQHLRLDSYSALAAGELGVPGQSSERRVLEGLNDAQPSGAGDLAGLAEALATHRTARPDAHFMDASFLLREALEVAIRIVDAAEHRQPFSLIRLGDGEGAMLPYRRELDAFRGTDLAANSKTWWGSDGPPTAALAAELQEAIRGADVVGVPDLDRATRVFFQTERTAHLANGRNMRGLLAAADFVVANCPTAVWTTCHIHQSLAFWGLWDVVLPRLADFDLVTCHGELGAVLAREHGVRIGRTHLVPPERKYAAAFADGSADQHYPTAFERLREVLPDAARGRTVLVSAGMLGKIYCHWIRQAGGVAIDIGSAADHWCGYGTRGIADVALYRSPTGTGDLVRSLVSGHPRYSRLLAGTDETRLALEGV